MILFLGTILSVNAGLVLRIPSGTSEGLHQTLHIRKVPARITLSKISDQDEKISYYYLNSINKFLYLVRWVILYRSLLKEDYKFGMSTCCGLLISKNLRN